tara:strand:+ start:1685 stop:2509 length:825 start_codon:yes stop_codon:yes gene_type:complete
MKYLILIALFSHSALSKETPRERAKKLASKIYGTCHGGKPEKVSKLYLNNECREIEEENSLYVLDEGDFQKIEFEGLNNYGEANVPESMQDGIVFRGSVRVYQSKIDKPFWSPSLVSIEPLKLQNVTRLYEKKPLYREMKFEELKEYKDIVEIAPESFKFDKNAEIKMHDKIDKCMNYFFKDFEVVKCTKVVEGDFLETLLFNKKIIYVYWGGGPWNADISPGFQFDYLDSNYFIFYTLGKDKDPIVVFNNLEGGYEFVRMPILCPHASGDPCF